MSASAASLSVKLKKRKTKVNEEKKKTKKKLYLLCQSIFEEESTNYIWFVLDLDRWYAEREHEMTKCPSHLLDRYAYGMLALNSDMYFIGGVLLSHDAFDLGYSNLVYVYDTISKQWDDGHQITPMQSPRSHLTPVLANDQSGIFVFGSSPFEKYHPLPVEHWVEFYNFSSKKWIYIPGTPTKVYKSGFHSHIVRGDFIYFWIHQLGVYTFDMKNRLWNQVDFSLPDEPEYFRTSHTWSNQVAIVDDVLYYHCYGDIYAHHFNTNKTVSLFSMEDEFDDFSAYYTFGELWIYCPTFLVHLGDKTLCLFWADMNDETKVHSYQFQVTTDADGELDIVFKGRKHFAAKGCYTLQHFMELGDGWPNV